MAAWRTAECDRASEIAQEIADTPARTMAGLLVKIRAVKWGNPEWWNREGKPDAHHWADELAAEILDAVEQLAKLQSATPAGEA